MAGCDPPVRTVAEVSLAKLKRRRRVVHKEEAPETGDSGLLRVPWGEHRFLGETGDGKRGVPSPRRLQLSKP
jgi:hypothetical protein